MRRTLSDGALPIPKAVEDNLEESMEKDAGESYYIVIVKERQCSVYCSVYTYPRAWAALRFAELSMASAEERSGEVRGGEGHGGVQGAVALYGMKMVTRK